MGGPLDSLGLDLVVAGVVIALAGMFLTPMRSVVLHAIRIRRARPATAPQTEPESVTATATSAVSVPGSVMADGGHREQEALFARTLLTAQKTADDLVRNAQAEAQTIIRFAETEAEDIVRAGRRNASEILQKSQQDADIIVESAKHKAAAWLAALQAEADKLAVDAHRAFQGAQRSVEQNVASLAARFEHRVAEWEAGSWKPQRAVPSLDGAAEPPPEHPSSPSDPAFAGRDGAGQTPTTAGRIA